jgi:hypothetical protein
MTTVGELAGLSKSQLVKRVKAIEVQLADAEMKLAFYALSDTFGSLRGMEDVWCGTCGHQLRSHRTGGACTAAVVMEPSKWTSTSSYRACGCTNCVPRDDQVKGEGRRAKGAPSAP